MFTLPDLLEATGGRLTAGDTQAVFKSISIDSRTTSPGELFVAFRGERQNGHAFVADALRHGASGALVDESVADNALSSLSSGQAIVRCENTGTGLRIWPGSGVVDSR